MSKILIIQDSLAVNALLKNRLQMSGFSVETVETGEDGIKKAKQGQYQLVLLDYKLPGIDGAEVCQILKKEQNTKNIPVVFMSALDEDKLSKIIEEVGAAGFIGAPFEGKEFIEKIRGFIKTRINTDEKTD